MAFPPALATRLVTTRRLSAIVAVAIAGTLLTGCSAYTQATMQHTQLDYSSWADATGAAASTLPGFIPHDAKNLNLRTLPGHGATLRFTSAASVSSPDCSSGALTGKPRIQSNWWPTTKPPATGTVCSGGWRLFVVDGTTYGWTPLAVG
jgi:hypothetical protein